MSVPWPGLQVGAFTVNRTRNRPQVRFRILAGVVGSHAAVEVTVDGFDAGLPDPIEPDAPVGKASMAP
jgi:hypothetical protein